jgi:hypothetical protein
VSLAREALKRYLVLSLIENEAMANNTKIMSDISQNAIKAAETMKVIDDMFWNKKKETPVMDNNYPNINNNNPYIPQAYPPQPPQQQQQMQPQQQFSYPAFQANSREAEERQQRVANYQLLVQNLYAQINNLQTQLFDGVQKIHQQVGEISKNLYQ